VVVYDPCPPLPGMTPSGSSSANTFEASPHSTADDDDYSGMPELRDADDDDYDDGDDDDYSGTSLPVVAIPQPSYYPPGRSIRTSPFTPHTAAGRSTWTSRFQTPAAAGRSTRTSLFQPWYLRFITDPTTDNELADPHSWAVFICSSFDGMWDLWAIREDDVWDAVYVPSHCNPVLAGRYEWTEELRHHAIIREIHEWEAWDARNNPDTVLRCSAAARAVLDRWVTDDDAFTDYAYVVQEDVGPMIVSDGVRDVLRDLQAGIHPPEQLPSEGPA
jgi:hypothetical protein